MLEIAILGLLSESPMHGYELRKRLNTLLGHVSDVLLRVALPDASAHGVQTVWISSDGATQPARGPQQGRLPAHR